MIVATETSVRPYVLSVPFKAIKVFCTLVAVLLLAASGTAWHVPIDWLIIPTARVGPIVASSTELSLRETFGEKFVVTERIGDEVQTNRYMSFVFRDDLTKAIAISWKDNRNKTLPATISFCWGTPSYPGAWRTRSGIRCGMTLRELEALNELPFVLSGYDRDLSGTVISWEGGKLDLELGPKGAFEISVAPVEGNWRKQLTAAERRSLDRHSILSSDAVIQRLNPVVYRMVFRFVSQDNKRAR